MIDGRDFFNSLLGGLWPWSTRSASFRNHQEKAMPEMAQVAVQTTAEPTNKLSAGTTAAAGVGAVIAGALAAYGNEALRDVLLEVAPALAAKAATTNFLVFLLVTIAAYVANKYAGLSAGYNVLDKPNVPLEPVTPSPAVPPASTPPTTT